jgi:hypothetical protein
MALCEAAAGICMFTTDDLRIATIFASHPICSNMIAKGRRYVSIRGCLAAIPVMPALQLYCIELDKKTLPGPRWNDSELAARIERGQYVTCLASISHVMRISNKAKEACATPRCRT